MLRPRFDRRIARPSTGKPMPLVRSLMHLALCLILILNGSVQALAGEIMHAQGHQMTDAKLQHAVPDCHEQPPTAHAENVTVSMSDLQHFDEDQAGCCKSSNSCDCACQQHSPVAATLVASFVAAADDTQVILPAKTGHAPPSPTRSIRPPIA